MNASWGTFREDLIVEVKPIFYSAESFAVTFVNALQKLSPDLGEILRDYPRMKQGIISLVVELLTCSVCSTKVLTSYPDNVSAFAKAAVWCSLQYMAEEKAKERVNLKDFETSNDDPWWRSVACHIAKLKTKGKHT